MCAIKRSSTRAAIAAVSLLFTAANAESNAPGILRQASFGGSGNDVPFQVRVTPEQSLVIGGESNSSNGNKTSPAFGGRDFWILKCSASGAITWDRSFGGSADDQLFALQVVRTNQLLLAGASSSPVSGNKTTQNYGMRDFWVLLLDANGQKLWERSFGGAGDDFATCATELDGGGFVVAGYSASAPGGNKNAPLRGEGDFWVVRLDPNGNKLWDQSYGGASDDCAFNAVAVPGGAVLLAGNSASAPGGNKRTPNYGLYDLWLLKLDTAGDLVWEKTYGGDSDDGYYQVSLARTAQGEILLAAESYSGVSGNKAAPNFGNEDFWLLRLDASGNKLWETNYGGADSDYPMALLVTADGACIMGGGSNSGPSGNKTTPNRGSTDFCLAKFDAQGKLQWDKTIGGTDTDALLSLALAQAADGTLFCCGDSVSGSGGDKTVACAGGADFWFVSLGTVSSGLAPRLEITLQGGQPSLILHGQAGNTYVTEASSNLQTWTAVSTNQLSSSSAVVTDPGWAGASRRSYRAWLKN